MATTRFPGALETTPFPAPGVAAGIQRAVEVARGIGSRGADASRRHGTRESVAIVDRTFHARRLHVVRRDTLRGPARAV
jgi:hypothetical protein